jgi:hypothetical protein
MIADLADFLISLIGAWSEAAHLWSKVENYRAPLPRD